MRSPSPSSRKGKVTDAHGHPVTGGYRSAMINTALAVVAAHVYFGGMLTGLMPWMGVRPTRHPLAYKPVGIQYMVAATAANRTA